MNIFNHGIWAQRCICIYTNHQISEFYSTNTQALQPINPSPSLPRSTSLPTYLEAQRVLDTKSPFRRDTDTGGLFDLVNDKIPKKKKDTRCYLYKERVQGDRTAKSEQVGEGGVALSVMLFLWNLSIYLSHFDILDPGGKGEGGREEEVESLVLDIDHPEPKKSARSIKYSDSYTRSVQRYGSSSNACMKTSNTHIR